MFVVFYSFSHAIAGKYAIAFSQYIFHYYGCRPSGEYTDEYTEHVFMYTLHSTVYSCLYTMNALLHWHRVSRKIQGAANKIKIAPFSWLMAVDTWTHIGCAQEITFKFIITYTAAPRYTFLVSIPLLLYLHSNAKFLSTNLIYDGCHCTGTACLAPCMCCI